MKNKIYAFALALLAAAAPMQTAPASAGDELPKKVVAWVDAYEAFDLERFLSFYADNVSFKDPTAQINFPSKEVLTQAYTGIMQGRWGGNFQFDIQSVIESGNTVVMEGEFSLTFNGEMGKIHFSTWLDYEDGKIVRQLDLFDYAALRRQMPNYGQGMPTEYTGPRD